MEQINYYLNKCRSNLWWYRILHNLIFDYYFLFVIVFVVMNKQMMSTVYRFVGLAFSYLFKFTGIGYVYHSNPDSQAMLKQITKNNLSQVEEIRTMLREYRVD